jgi:ectonucleotide pyrophosphatase/phosphodiesterase family protein 5
MRLVALALWIGFVPFVHASSAPPHVYLVVIDGLGREAVDAALMPRLADPALCEDGVGEARAVMPTRTNPNHVTLLTGVLPESHGITGNGYFDRRAGVVKSVDAGELIEVETLFTLAATRQPPLVTIAAFSKAKIGRLFAPVPGRQHGPDVLWTPVTEGPAGHLVGVASDAETMDAFLAAAGAREPDLAAINLSEVDRTAHERGPTATADARRHADAALGRLVDDLRASGRWSRSIVIVTADHGFDDISPTPDRAETAVMLATRFAGDGLTGVRVVGDGGVAHVYAEEIAPEAERVGEAASALGWAASIAWREPGVAAVLARLPIPGLPTLADLHPDWGLGHERVGDLLIVARPGFQFVDATDLVARGFRGNHGSPREMRVPLVIAGGALARTACTFDVPPSSADLGTTIGAILGMPTPRRFDARPVRAGHALALPLREEEP